MGRREGPAPGEPAGCVNAGGLRAPHRPATATMAHRCCSSSSSSWLCCDGFQPPFPHFATIAIHYAQEPEQWNSRAVVPPITLTASFKQEDLGKDKQEDLCKNKREDLCRNRQDDFCKNKREERWKKQVSGDTESGPARGTGGGGAGKGNLRDSPCPSVP